MTAPITLWSKLNADGDTVLIANTDKTAIVECDRCPCDDGALIWDITIGAGETYLLWLYIFADPATGGLGRAIIDWGDGNRTTLGPYTSREAHPNHLYVEGGTYTVTIRGDVKDFRHLGVNTKFPVLVRMLNLRSFTGSTLFWYHKFEDCLNITAIAPGCLFSEGFWDGENMFRRCTSLTTIPDITFSLASGEQYLDLNHMFHDCSALTSVGKITISNSVSIRMDSIFAGTGITVLPEFIFPARVPELTANNAFASCSSLTGVVSEDTPCTFAFPDKIDGDLLANSMFASCSALTTAPTLAFPTSVGGNCNLSQMFYSDSALSSDLYLLFPESVGGDFNASSMFMDCTSLGKATLLHFPQSVTNSFTTSMMFESSGLKEITAMVFPSSVDGTFNLSSMFTGCARLHTIPPTLDFTSDKAVDYFTASYMFCECTALTGHTSVIFPDIVTGTFTIDLMFCVTDITGIDTFSFPSSTGTFSALRTFRNCAALVTFPALDFPATVTGDFRTQEMFSVCSELWHIPSVTFPYDITGGFRIDYMFEFCNKATEIQYPWYFPNSFRSVNLADCLSNYQIRKWGYFDEQCGGNEECANEGFYDSSNWLPHGYHPPFWNIVESGPVMVGCSNVCSVPSTYWDSPLREKYFCN